MKHLQYFENYLPIENDVNELFSYLAKNYPIEERDGRFFDKQSLQFIVVDDKVCLLENKSELRKKLLWDIKYRISYDEIDEIFNKNYSDASINKAIKLYLEMATNAKDMGLL